MLHIQLGLPDEYWIDETKDPPETSLIFKETKRKGISDTQWRLIQYLIPAGYQIRILTLEGYLIPPNKYKRVPVSLAPSTLSVYRSTFNRMLKDYLRSDNETRAQLYSQLLETAEKAKVPNEDLEAYIGVDDPVHDKRHPLYYNPENMKKRNQEFLGEFTPPPPTHNEEVGESFVRIAEEAYEKEKE